MGKCGRFVKYKVVLALLWVQITTLLLLIEQLRTLKPDETSNMVLSHNIGCGCGIQAESIT